MKRDFRDKPFTRMVVIGDSIAKGACATQKEYSWVYRLAELISQCQEKGIEMINAGIAGNLISNRSKAYNHQDAGKPSALERYRRDVIENKPDLIVISFGLNDVRCGTPVDVFIEDMGKMIDVIKKETQGIIVLVNMYFITGYKKHGEVWGYADIASTREYNSQIEQYAAENDLLYADVFSAQAQADWVVDADGVHPNNLGHLLIANKVFETIASNCSCLSIKAYKQAGEF